MDAAGGEDRAVSVGRQLYVGHRAFDGLSVASVLPIDVVLAAEGSSVGLGPETSAPIVRTLEAEGAYRSRWTNDHIEQVAGSFVEDTDAYEAATAIPYASSRALEVLVGRRKLAAALAPDHDLKRYLDDKRVGREVFDDCGLPSLPHRLASLESTAHETAAKELGLPYVIRALRGSTGSGVFLVKDRAAFDHVAHIAGSSASEEWLYETYVKGYSVNSTAVCGERSVVTFAPSVQLIGLPSCTDLDFGFCGNDYAAYVSVQSAITKQVEDQTVAIGDAIRQLGYLGLFGVDFLVGNGAVFPCEINPRFQNSTALLNFAHRSRPTASPAAQHVAAFRRTVPSVEQGEHIPVPLSQVILYAPSRATSSMTAQPLAEGIYADTGTGLKYRKPPCNPLDLGAEEVLIVGASARPNMAVEPGAGIARIVFPRQVFELESNSLSSYACNVVEFVRGSVSLERGLE